MLSPVMLSNTIVPVGGVLSTISILDVLTVALEPVLPAASTLGTLADTAYLPSVAVGAKLAGSASTR